MGIIDAQPQLESRESFAVELGLEERAHELDSVSRHAACYTPSYLGAQRGSLGTFVVN